MVKVIYKNSNNISTEANVYTASEFIASFSGASSKPVLTNSSGLIDASLIPGTPATSLQFTKIATEAITIGDCVKADNDTHVSLATYNSTVDAASVLGVATNAAAIGEMVTIVVIGVITNSIFNIFPVNKQLFLEIDGAVTDERIINGYSTVIGKSLGSGSIYVNVREPERMVG